MYTIQYPTYLYHGTSVSDKSKVGNIIGEFKSTPVNPSVFTDEKDFGPALYLTSDRIQATTWALGNINDSTKQHVPVIVKFELIDNGQLSDFEHMLFLGVNNNWAQFIADHRTTGINSEPCQKHPDFVYGPMANVKDVSKKAYRYLNVHKSIDIFLNEIIKDMSYALRGNAWYFWGLGVAQRSIK